MPNNNQVGVPQRINHQFGGPQPCNNQFVGPRPSHNQLDDPQPCNNQFGGPQPSNNQFMGPWPSHNQLDDPQPYNNQFGGPQPSNNQFVGPQPSNNQFGGPYPYNSYLVQRPQALPNMLDYGRRPSFHHPSQVYPGANLNPVLVDPGNNPAPLWQPEVGPVLRPSHGLPHEQHKYGDRNQPVPNKKASGETTDDSLEKMLDELMRRYEKQDSSTSGEDAKLEASDEKPASEEQQFISTKKPKQGSHPEPKPGKEKQASSNEKPFRGSQAGENPGEGKLAASKNKSAKHDDTRAKLIKESYPEHELDEGKQVTSNEKPTERSDRGDEPSEEMLAASKKKPPQQDDTEEVSDERPGVEEQHRISTNRQLGGSHSKHKGEVKQSVFTKWATRNHTPANHASSGSAHFVTNYKPQRNNSDRSYQRSHTLVND